MPLVIINNEQVVNIYNNFEDTIILIYNILQHTPTTPTPMKPIGRKKNVVKKSKLIVQNKKQGRKAIKGFTLIIKKSPKNRYKWKKRSKLV